jgi:hypothetical protein
VRIAELRTYLQRVGDRPRVLVKITTEDGVAGWSEVYNHGPDLAYPPLLEYLFAQIKGMDARRPSHVNQFRLQSGRFPQGALGLAAIAAIDNALWDVAARSLGVPVYQLIGGAVRERPRRILGIDASATLEQTRDQVARIARHTADLIGLDRDLRDDEITVLEGWAGDLYGIPVASTVEAIKLSGRLEGMIIDPVYEGKSMAGLIDLVRRGEIPRTSNVLYAHLGGQPALNAYSGVFS